MAQLVLPRVHAMVLCDRVEDSEYEADVFNLVGVRTTIESPFPAVVSQLCLFVQITGHEGEASFHVEVEFIASSEVIYESLPETIGFEGPAKVVPVVFPLSNCVFPVDGVYYVQLYHDQKMIGERPLSLRQED